MAPREDRIVILTTGSRTTRAGHGIHELLQKPSVQVSTRAAKRVNNGNGESEWIVGEELDKMIARHDSVDVIYPIRGGRVGDWQALIAIWRHVLFQLLGIRTARNDSPILISLPPTLTRETLAIATESIFDVFNAPGLCIAEEPQVSAYAAGVLTATVIDIGWEHCTITPVSEQNGVVNHAVTRSDVGLRHVAIYLAFLLSKDESVVQALITLNARRNAREESEGGNNSSDQLAVRLFELAVHLIGQGKVKTTLQGEGYANQVAREDEAEAEFDIAAALVAGREKAAVEEQERRNKAALEASNREADQGLAPTAQGQDVLLSDKSEIQVGASKEEGAETVQFQGITIKVGPGPLSQACEPLWDPSVLSVLRGKLASSATSSLGPLDLGSVKVNSDYSTLRSLPSSIASSITAAGEPEKRAQLWETLLATGAPVRLLQNFSSVLVAACQSSCLASSRGADQGSGATSALAGGGSGGISRESPGIGGLEDTSQPTNARCIKTPDYFAEFKDRTDLAPFLGATIYAKLAFTDPYGRLVTSKAVYNEKGPSATFLVSAPS